MMSTKLIHIYIYAKLPPHSYLNPHLIKGLLSSCVATFQMRLLRCYLTLPSAGSGSGSGIPLPPGQQAALGRICLGPLKPGSVLAIGVGCGNCSYRGWGILRQGGDGLLVH